MSLRNNRLRFRVTQEIIPVTHGAHMSLRETLLNYRVNQFKGNSEILKWIQDEWVPSLHLLSHPGEEATFCFRMRMQMQA